ncbi:MAG: SpoIIE family protein phosphatase [Bacteroidia bacterium]|nr:SpoIIE family protein phosphatase [Bacteroidia bacterium]
MRRLRRVLVRIGWISIGLIGLVVGLLAYFAIKVLRAYSDIYSNAYTELYEPINLGEEPLRRLETINKSEVIPTPLRLQIPASVETVSVRYPEVIMRRAIPLRRDKVTSAFLRFAHPLTAFSNVQRVELAQVAFFVQSRVKSGMMKLWGWHGRDFEELAIGRWGDVWASSAQWVMRWDGLRVEEIRLPEELRAQSAPALIEDTCGLWALWRDTLLFYDGFGWYGKKPHAPLVRSVSAPSGGFIASAGWGEEISWYTRDSLYIIRLRGLRVLPAGWIGENLGALFESSTGQGLLLWSNGQTLLLMSQKPLWRDRSSVLIGEGQGKVLFASDEGTFLYEAGSLYRIGDPLPVQMRHLAVSSQDYVVAESRASSAYLDPGGRWRLETLVEEVRENLTRVGLYGELWRFRSYGIGEALLAILRDDLIEPLELPFQEKVLDFLCQGDSLWVLTQAGQLWLCDGKRWHKLKFPYPFRGAKLFWDATESALWVMGAHPLVCWRDGSWKIYDIDSVSGLARTESGALWLLRNGRLYLGGKYSGFKLSKIQFIGTGPENQLWIVADSGVYLLRGDELWKVKAGAYRALAIDSEGRLWVEPEDAKGQGVVGLGPNFPSDQNLKVASFYIGPSSGLQKALYAIGGRDTLWWQAQDNQLLGLQVSRIRQETKKITFLGISAHLLYSPQASYISLPVPFAVSQTERGKWRDKTGLFLLAEGGLYFYREGERTHPLPPRLRVKWRKQEIPFTIGALNQFAEEEQVELGTISSLEESKNSTPLETALKGARGRWPNVTMAPFEISYFAQDITFTFAPVGQLVESPFVEYQYRLKGQSDGWSKPSSEGKAFFYRLSEGSYTLEVRQRRMGGPWSQSTEWSFYVKPPPWRTPLAYLTYALLIGGGITLYVRYRTRALRRRAAELQQEVDKATLAIRAQNEALQAANKELAAQRDLIESQRQGLIDSLTYAQRIQRALIPPFGALSRFFPESFILFLPRDIVSGDVYWFHAPKADDSELLLLAADCTGHGVPGAFMSLLTLSLLERAVNDVPERTPSVLLDRLSSQIIRMLNPEGGEEIRDGFEGVLCRFMRREGGWILEYAAARRACWLVRQTEVMELPKDPIPVGLSGIPALRGVSFMNRQVELEPGDWLYFSTDGYTDQLGGEEVRRFGTKRFRSLLQELSRLPSQTQREKLYETFESWCIQGNMPQIDDVLVIGIQIPKVA